MSLKEYSGINIQWPISDLILSGSKSIETRTYPVPPKYLGEEIIMIETPGKRGAFKARMRGIIRFTDCFKYSNAEEFYSDRSRHCVTPDSPWAWEDQKPKWGWNVEIVEIFREPMPLQKPSGIKFSKGIKLENL